MKTLAQTFAVMLIGAVMASVALGWMVVAVATGTDTTVAFR